GRMIGTVRLGSLSLIALPQGKGNREPFHGYIAKVNFNANTVKGTIFIDSNNNGTFETFERQYSNLMLETTPGFYYSLSEQNGNYKIYLPPGTSIIYPPTSPRYYSIIPNNQTVNFNGTNQTLTGKDFALQPKPDNNDVKVTITASTISRPGFTFNYRITYYNSGTTVLSDTIRLIYDGANLNYVSASRTPSYRRAGKLEWQYLNLQPNETQSFDVTFFTPAYAVLGTGLRTIASIKPYNTDLYQADNADTLHHLVTGSYDPNDKQVDQPFISPATALAGGYLDYTIRFQNTGTDTAFTVIVADKISSALQLNTLEMLSASHPYKLSISGNNTLEWRFDNILLPDSNRNELARPRFCPLPH
ncbi:MAG TPA: hypothetical protein VD794_09840, partial [Flavisolibacter sp.]|nr:hypothetical protein [Flavisolibacter sp.]